MAARRGTLRACVRCACASVGWGSAAIAAIALMLAGCTGMPMTSAGAQDLAIRLAATETAQIVQATGAALATEQAHVRETQAANDATSQAATAVIARATEMSAEATAQAVKDQAMIRHAEASVTAAWYHAELTAIPGKLTATASRQAVVAQRADMAEDVSAWLLMGLCCASVLMVVGTAGWEIIEPAIDNWVIIRDMTRVIRQPAGTQPYDVTGQTKIEGEKP